MEFVTAAQVGQVKHEFVQRVIFILKGRGDGKPFASVEATENDRCCIPARN